MLWLTQHQLKSKDPAARRKAVQQLCEQPHPRSLPALTTALRDEDVEVRRLAAIALGKLEDEGRIEPLLGALRDPNAEVLQAVILAFKRILDERVRPAMVPLLRHADAGVRGQAAHLLEAHGWRPAGAEEEICLVVAKGQFARLGGFGAAAVPALEAVIEAGPYSLCLGAIEALGEIGDARAVRPLLRALKAREASVCVAALDALCRLRDLQAVGPIIGMLNHREGAVRVAAIDTLRRLGALTAVEPLCERLRDPVWDVRRAAAEALGRLRDPRAMDALAAALEDADGDVREASAMGLGSLADRRVIGPLVLALKDPVSGVRRIAAAALARIDPAWSSSPEARGAIEELKAALQNGDANVQHFVGQLLVNLGALDPALAPVAAAEDLSVSSGAKSRKLAVSLFIALLCDANRDLRQAAVEALGRLADERAQPPLVRALGDADPGVRESAGLALQAFGGAT